MESKNEEKIGTIQKELACEVENFKAMIKKEPLSLIHIFCRMSYGVGS